jgi:beta-lactamase class D
MDSLNKIIAGKPAKFWIEEYITKDISLQLQSALLKKLTKENNFLNGRVQDLKIEANYHKNRINSNGKRKEGS